MDFIDDFIKEYKHNPCLWKAGCSDFKNKVKRQEAYLKLIDVATKHGEHYNVERTKQKINNLRCAFRHQLKKYNELKKKGEKYEPYCPKRRYFESLMFLKDEEIPDKRAKRDSKVIQDNYSESVLICNPSESCEDYSEIDNLQKKSGTEHCGSMFEESAASDPLKSIPKRTNISMKEVEVIMPAETQETNEEKSINTDNNSVEITNAGKEQNEAIFEYDGDNDNIQKTNKKSHRKRSPSISSQVSNETEHLSKPLKNDSRSAIDFDKLLSLALKNVTSNIDDHFTNFGKIIAHKLRIMDPIQAIYAEKIIADVLYQGQMKMLSTLSIHQFQCTESSHPIYAENHK